MVPEEFIDAGDDQVLVFSREGGRGRGSGAEVQTNPTAHLWTIRAGKAVRMESYWERSAALEAAGLQTRSGSAARLVRGKFGATHATELRRTRLGPASRDSAA